MLLNIVNENPQKSLPFYTLFAGPLGHQRNSDMYPMTRHHTTKHRNSPAAPL